jgi:hypothetical protein
LNGDELIFNFFQLSWFHTACDGYQACDV